MRSEPPRVALRATRGGSFLSRHQYLLISLNGSACRFYCHGSVFANFWAGTDLAMVSATHDVGSFVAREPRIFTRQLGLKPCYTPVKSPQDNGISEAFVLREDAEVRLRVCHAAV